MMSGKTGKRRFGTIMFLAVVAAAFIGARGYPARAAPPQTDAEKIASLMARLAALQEQTAALQKKQAAPRVPAPAPQAARTGGGVSAAPTLPPVEIAGWVPYWRTATGTADAIAHMDALKEISPFGYAVKNDGTLVDQMHLDAEAWQALAADARAKKVKIIPTIMWSDGGAIHRVLSNAKLRNAHIAAIVTEVNARGWDGIDIDYEGKKADTKQYFSIFLRDLYKAIGKKFVSCTIEARTPLADRFVTIPKDVRFANDYAAINKYCDRVRIMAYDQGSIDLKLNKAAAGYYAPVADPQWVEKVVRVAMQAIAKKKIFIGVATYGYEYEVSPYGRGFAYDRLWSFNPRYATELAARLGVTPVRNTAGELSFAYMPPPAAPPETPSDDIASSSAVTPEDVDGAAAMTSPIAAASASPASPERLVWWSDASAIGDKVRLARKLGIRGIAVFKIDGGEDPGMWDALK